MKKIIVLTISCFFAFNIYAQLVTDEQPYGLKDNFKARSHDKAILIAPDIARIERDDKVNDQLPGPIRYAYPIGVNYTLENSGVWQNMDDGSKIWRLIVNIQDALSTNTYYDRFWLPEGAKFFVYSEDTRQSIGAIVSDFIGGSKEQPIEFATAIIYGENVTYQYYQPASVKESPDITISRIDYGYRYVDNPYINKTRGFGEAGGCMVNINCQEGDNWQMEKHAITRISVVFHGGSGWCSGALINNTTNNYTPYVLTANHCLEDANLDAVNNPNANQWTFYWAYEHSGCVNIPIQPTHRTTVGATVIANNSLSDFALLKLNTAQDPNKVQGITPYYLGWDRSGNSGTGGVGIHHPRGDVKKISTYTMTPQSTAYLSNTVNSNENNWRIIWSQTTNNGVIKHGVTERGSSGSPLINNNRKVIGQLHGGYADCNNTIVNGIQMGPNEPDWYGKFSVSWTGSSTSTPAPDNRRRLNYWLDPIGTNTLTLDGYRTISGPDTISCLGGSTYYLNNPPSGTINWKISSGYSLVSNTGTSVTVIPLASNMTGYLTAEQGGKVIAHKNFQPCNNLYFLTGPDTVCTSAVYYVSPYDSITWEVMPPTNFTIRPSSNGYSATVSVVPGTTGFGGTILVKKNGNVVVYKNISICSRSTGSGNNILAYPNPASDIITVVLNSPFETQARTSSQTALNFNIYLYNEQGVLMRHVTSKGNNVEINVSGLPNGYYYLHVYDGVNPMPEMRAILVKH